MPKNVLLGPGKHIDSGFERESVPCRPRVTQTTVAVSVVTWLCGITERCPAGRRHSAAPSQQLRRSGHTQRVCGPQSNNSRNLRQSGSRPIPARCDLWGTAAFGQRVARGICASLRLGAAEVSAPRTFPLNSPHDHLKNWQACPSRNLRSLPAERFSALPVQNLKDFWRPCRPDCEFKYAGLFTRLCSQSAMGQIPDGHQNLSVIHHSAANGDRQRSLFRVTPLCMPPIPSGVRACSETHQYLLLRLGSR